MQTENEPRTRSQLLVTGDQVAQMLSIGRTTLRKLVSEGRLPVVKIGRLARYRIEDITRLINESCSDAQAGE